MRVEPERIESVWPGLYTRRRFGWLRLPARRETRGCRPPRRRGRSRWAPSCFPGLRISKDSCFHFIFFSVCYTNAGLRLTRKNRGTGTTASSWYIAGLFPVEEPINSASLTRWHKPALPGMERINKCLEMNPVASFVTVIVIH